MVLKPNLEDLKAIGYYLGKIIIGLGLTMLIPLVWAFIFAEFNPLYDFLIGFLICLILGNALILTCKTDKDLNWVGGWW